mmetsp:Transcript_49617/g.124426  ORF Transcript_49617/g.124426 Transcript_49617/m.124426 type:complete len:166 (-) Transcript_49617:542-1039(-)
MHSCPLADQSHKEVDGLHRPHIHYMTAQPHTKCLSPRRPSQLLSHHTSFPPPDQVSNSPLSLTAFIVSSTSWDKGITCGGTATFSVATPPWLPRVAKLRSNGTYDCRSPVCCPFTVVLTSPCKAASAADVEGPSTSLSRRTDTTPSVRSVSHTHRIQRARASLSS